MQIGIAHRPCLGETVCGDASAVIELEGVTTLALADGLGHGPGAAKAAQRFCRLVGEHGGRDLEALMYELHGGLRGTRGAAGAVLRFDSQRDTLEFVGIGNIDVRAASDRSIGAVSLPGVLGHQMRKVRVFEFGLCAGDAFFIFSDGISGRFEPWDYRRLEAGAAAEKILVEHGKSNDDASCIVVHYGA